MTKRFLLVGMLIVISTCAKAQVKWMTFESLDSALNVNPKPVMLDFYTDWCVYCKKMDKEVFTHQEIINRLNNDYYAVRFDAETNQAISFDGTTFTKEANHRFHPLAMLFASRSNQFNPPAVIFLDSSFKIKERHLEYISRKQLQKRLEKYADR